MFLIELLALADFYTDCKVLHGLLKSIHIAWASLTIFSMLAAFYICHIPYMSFLIDKISKYNYKKQSWKQYILFAVMVTPLMVVYLLFMDLFFLLYAVLLKPMISSIVKMRKLKRVSQKRK